MTPISLRASDNDEFVEMWGHGPRMPSVLLASNPATGTQGGAR